MRRALCFQDLRRAVNLVPAEGVSRGACSEAFNDIREWPHPKSLRRERAVPIRCEDSILALRLLATNIDHVADFVDEQLSE